MPQGLHQRTWGCKGFIPKRRDIFNYLIYNKNIIKWYYFADVSSWGGDFLCCAQVDGVCYKPGG